MAGTTTNEEIINRVRERYANAAVQVARGASCCGPDCCGGEIATATEAFGATAYAPDELAILPTEAVNASLGCGNPTALADLRAGEIVLDLGSGGGIDVLLSARRVGPAGKAYGLDMTEEMLALARENQRVAGVTNVEFLKGRIEAVPLPASSVDVIISNCVVNLSTDKDAVLREAFRVLRPGGRVAINDVVVRDAEAGEPPIPEAVRRDLELWAGCVAGALDAADYRAKLAAAGFEGIEIHEVKRYTLADLTGSACGGDTTAPAHTALDEAAASRFTSAFVRATKPLA